MRVETENPTVTFPEIPVLTGMQAQGDLLIVPWPADTAPIQRKNDTAAAKPLTKPVVVLAGNNGHSHTLSPTPGARWYPYQQNMQTLGVLVVDEGNVGVLGHIEHGDTHIGPGVYVIRRQREQADTIRMLAD